MDFRYQSLEWSSDPRFRAEPSTTTQQSLDDLINAKCLIGWELYGVYAESADGSKYRVLFRVPCPERERLAQFAWDTGHAFQAARKQAAEALLADLIRLHGVLGLRVTKLSGSGKGAEVEHDFSAKGAAVIIDSTGAITIRTGIRPGATPEVPLWFNSASGVLEPVVEREKTQATLSPAVQGVGVLEPEDSAKAKGLGSQTALGVLVDAILTAMK